MRIRKLLFIECVVWVADYDDCGSWSESNFLNVRYDEGCVSRSESNYTVKNYA